ncbi:MAG TPA: DUF1579 domain-containing protein [Chloroflexia bacterium]|nr:DUF1579 domain-containing protein [Chloroflexia bacterium]
MNLISGLHDFDFLDAKWQIKNRRKKAHLLTDNPTANKNAQWEEFTAIGGMAQTQLGGRCKIDFFEGTFPDGEAVKGMAVRTYDEQKDEWSFVWLDNRQPSDWTPLVGRFEGNVGLFYQTIQAADGQPLKVRFTWEKFGHDSARWQQAFSLDGGQTWDTNWIMDYSR